MVAEIIINRDAKNINKIFDYLVPRELEKIIKIGARVFVPFGASKRTEAFVINLKENSQFATKNIISIEDFLLTNENIKLAKLMSKRYSSNFSECIKLMLPPGTTTRNLENRIKDKTQNKIYLTNVKNEDINEKQKEILNLLRKNEGIQVTDFCKNEGITLARLKTLEKKNLITLVSEKIERNPFIHKNIQNDKALKLTNEQEEAYNSVLASINENTHEEFLIYGITGSGKTEIYLQLIDKVIKNGKTAIMLVPEISLTPQMVDRFLARFGDIVAVLHSKLSNGERYDQWLRIRENKAKIIIGARSAIFAPVSNIGIIIIDEEHDSSYKSETTPRYNVKEIAKYICKSEKIPLILGSATPDINTFYKAQNSKIKLLKLTKRANNSNLPEVKVVDLRKELAIGNKSMISTELYNEIAKNIKEKNQTILFLNRRGYSTSVMCRECGYTAKCKNCNITLTYHMNENILKCHYCGYETKNLSVCPECNSSKIKYFGTGTQKLETEIKKLFPQSTTIRMDVDTVTKKNSHEDILNKFKDEQIDILIRNTNGCKRASFSKSNISWGNCSRI